MKLRKARLFISYARADDEPFVERLYNDLKEEFEVWWDRVSMPNRGLTFLQEIREAVDHADRLLLIAGSRAFTSEYVREEWQYAYEIGKGINIALRLGDYGDFPTVLRGYDAPDFRRDEDYDERLTTLKRQLSEPIAPIGRLCNVPAPPPHFVNRPDALDALRELVIADVDKPTLISAEPRATAVEGMGGIGKSVLAAAFAHDRKVRFAFPDGIVWLTAGRDAKLLELYRAVGVPLGDDWRNYPDETTARQNAQKVISARKCLLILDDVWELSVGRAFRDLISDTTARLLITTRNLQIKDALNTNEYRLRLIDKSQAADYLRSWVGEDPNLNEIADKLGYLFLALNLAGRLMKENEVTGSEYLSMFERVSDMEISPKREDSLEISINLGVDAAFANYRDRRLLYYTLGIFQEDAGVPQQTILQLWSHLRPDIRRIDHLKTLTTLVNLGLVERNRQNIITLHDLLHSYTHEKLGDRYVQTHQDLLLTYRKPQKGEGWHTIPDDGYLYDYLTYHLISAQMYDDLRTLFLTDNWAHARVKQKEYLYEGYLSDVLVAWDFAHTQAFNFWDERRFADCARYALIVTKVNDLSTTYVPELVVRALQLNMEAWTNERALSIASKVSNPEQRLYFYVKLLSSGLFEGKQRELCVEKAIGNLQETMFNRPPTVWTRPGIEIEIYEELAASIQNDPQSFQRLMNALFEEDRESDIARVVARIGQYVPKDLLDGLLEKVLELGFDGDWGSLTRIAVAGIIGRLNKSQLDFIKNHKTLDTDTRKLIERHLTESQKNQETQGLELPTDYDEFIRSFEFRRYGSLWLGTESSFDIFKSIAGELSADQLNMLVEKALDFKDNSSPSFRRVEFFEILAPYLNEDLQIRALRRCSEIDGTLGWEFTSVLASLVSHLSPNSIAHAYEMLTKEAQHDRDRGFRILAPVLNEKLLVRAIKDSAQSMMPSEVVLAMTHFLPYLPSDAHRDIVMQIQAYITGLGRFSAFTKEELLVELAKASLKDIELVADIVRFIFSQDIYLSLVMSSLARLIQVLQQTVFHPAVRFLINDLLDQIDKFDDRDKPFVIACTLSLELRLVDMVPVENETELQEDYKDLLILAIRALQKQVNLQPFFSAIIVSQDYLDGDRLDQVLSLILDCSLDYSNTDDLSFFSGFAPVVSQKQEWVSELIDELIRIRHGNNTNAELLRALIPAFSDKPDLLHKALHYADVLQYADHRIPTVIEIASHLHDEYYRFQLISRELESIKNDVEEGMHASEISAVGRVLEVCGNTVSSFEHEFNVFVDVVNSLPNPYTRSRSLASVGSSPYFTEEMRRDLRKNVLTALLEERESSIACIWRILSYPPLLQHLALAPATISEIYDAILEIENQWEWL